MFIDGNHTDENVIFEDFLMCELLANDNSIIVWDDYYLDKFAIKPVVTRVLQKYPEYKSELVSFRGHLFSDKSPEKDCGMVIMTKENAHEDLLPKGK